MELTQIGFSNFRSIGAEAVFVDLTAKVNVIIGANNAGKSNVFRALEFMKRSTDERKQAALQLEYHKRDPSNQFLVTLVGQTEPEDGPIHEFFGKSDMRFTYEPGDGKRTPVTTPFAAMRFNEFARVYQSQTNEHFTRHLRDDEMPQYYFKLAAVVVNSLLTQIPRVHVIPAIRKVDKGQQYGLDGSGAIQTLATWKNPDIGHDELELRLDEVQRLLRRLLRMPNVRIEVPDTKDKIIVRNDGLRLPLESYGTGIHELLILAIDVYSKDNVIFCIEEPEIHLHPTLQREFMRFLIEETDNRYLLATHSHALMVPSANVAVTHLWLEHGVTQSRRVETSEHTLQVLSDLGVAASDILQANSVIWVEGPSDRIYLGRWLELLAPDLREGIDFAIMFYGGRLLAHLSLERDALPDTDDFIFLLRMNQHSAIIMDSDRSKTTGELNQTKQRICHECETHGITCWITYGREIENYIPSELLEEVYEELTGMRKPISFRRFARLDQAVQAAYDSSWRPKWSYDRAKVDMARRIASRFEEKHLSKELKAKVEQIVETVRRAAAR